MTSMAFIMGVVPLVFSSGAGFEIRQAMGIAVFAGMLGVTLFGLFLTPVFYVVIGRLTRRRSRAIADHGASAGGRTEGHDPEDVSSAGAKAPALRGVTRTAGDWMRGAAALRRADGGSIVLRNAEPASVLEQPFDPRWWRSSRTRCSTIS